MGKIPLGWRYRFLVLHCLAKLLQRAFPATSHSQIDEFIKEAESELGIE